MKRSQTPPPSSGGGWGEGEIEELTLSNTIAATRIEAHLTPPPSPRPLKGRGSSAL